MTDWKKLHLAEIEAYYTQPNGRTVPDDVAWLCGELKEAQSELTRLKKLVFGDVEWEEFHTRIHLLSKADCKVSTAKSGIACTTSGFGVVRYRNSQPPASWNTTSG